MKIRSIWIAGFWMLPLAGVSPMAPFPADSSFRSVRDSTRIQRGAEKDLTLEEIEIQGSIEKPSVTIVPKRIEPDLREVELNRSFDREVKDGVGEIPKQDEPLRKVETVTSIKKTIEKKRN